MGGNLDVQGSRAEKGRKRGMGRQSKRIGKSGNERDKKRGARRMKTGTGKRN